MDIARTVRLLFGSLAFILAFVVACVVIRSLFPFPEVPIVRAKLLHFREHANDYDTLFVGSSRIQYQVIPSSFDELTAAGGMPTKSFNAGVAGMRPPEDSYFFDHLLAAGPQRLRWVFIELGNIRPDIAEDRRGTMRAQYWHDWPRLWLLWQRVTHLKPTTKSRSLERIWRELREPLAEFPQHVELFVREMSNLGRGDFLTRQLVREPGDWRSEIPEYLGSDLAGWTETGRGEKMPPAILAKFEKERAERLTQPAVRDLGDPVSQEALEAMVEKVERLGATPVLIVAPITGKKNFFPTPERAQRTIVLDFSDPKRFPELYETGNRLDTDHLNTAGSRVFTRLIAERWLEEVKARSTAR